MSRVRIRNVYQYVFDFDKGRIVVYWKCRLSCHSIAARVGSDQMTVRRIWNRWFQNGKMECRAGSQRPLITSSQEDRHVIRMVLIDHAATSRSLSQELGSFARQQMSARTL
ncbi:HTH_Tnp_Tc3_2 domain-containing protein [Trichonephila clavipes]|nr:HTH_Tnp_Tc3_2 domain-containing protein [Trichonephila clavipes]